MRSAVLALLLALPPASSFGAEQSTFRLDEEPIFPDIFPVEGARMGVASPGDLLVVDDLPMRYQGPGAYHFRWEDREQTRLLCRVDDGPEQCVAIRVRPTGQSTGPAAVASPWDLMSKEEKQQLWGIDLRDEAPQWDQLEGIDWSKTALRIAALSDPIPPVFAELRLLTITPIESAKPNAFSGLRSLPNLRYLSAELSGEEFPLEAIAEANSLMNLDLRGATIRKPESLAGLTKLRFLKLRDLKGLDSLEFASGLSKLRVLKIDQSEVSNLSPLTGLDELRLLSLNGTKVASLLPLDALPALSDLRLHSTPAAKNNTALAPYRSAMSVLVKNWEPAIRAFEATDREKPCLDAVMFLGSSSIRLWNLNKFFPEVVTLNRGFGGSELSDSLLYYDRLVLPSRPRVILLYAGDNDIANGETAAQVVADWKRFAARTRKHLPETHVAYLPIKPSLARDHLWPEMRKANQAIAEFAATDPKLHYLDTVTGMLGPDGEPRPELFVRDGLHLSTRGYEEWTAVVKPWLGQFTD